MSSLVVNSLEVNLVLKLDYRGENYELSTVFEKARKQVQIAAVVCRCLIRVYVSRVGEDVSAH